MLVPAFYEFSAPDQVEAVEEARQNFDWLGLESPSMTSAGVPVCLCWQPATDRTALLNCMTNTILRDSEFQVLFSGFALRPIEMPRDTGNPSITSRKTLAVV